MDKESDQELLKLAAKAARIKLTWDVAGRVCWLDQPGSIVWSSLRNDGDALRLAADLDLFGDPSYWHWLAIARLGNSTNKYANVRLAITRAAAEIGRQMP